MRKIFKNHEEGAVLAEAALMLPVIIFLISASLEFAVVLNQRASLGSALFSAGRIAANTQLSDDICSRINTAMDSTLIANDILPSDYNITVTVVTLGGKNGIKIEALQSAQLPIWVLVRRFLQVKAEGVFLLEEQTLDTACIGSYNFN